MKKKILIAIIIILAFMLLFPIPLRLKDGGSIKFKALLYTITKQHKLAQNAGNTSNVYIDGIKIEILGMNIYDSTTVQDNEPKETFKLIFNKRSDLKIKTIINKNETDNYTYSIYSYGGDIRISINNIEYDLREALLNNIIKIEEVIEKANKDSKDKIIVEEMYKDGGSKMYKYGTYTIIKCNNLDGNKDVYIGVPEMELNDVM